MTADPTFPKKPAIAMEQLRKPSNKVYILGQEALTMACFAELVETSFMRLLCRATCTLHYYQLSCGISKKMGPETQNL